MSNAPAALNPLQAIRPMLVGIMAFLTMLWGLNALSIKVLTQDLPPLLAVALRGDIAVLFLLAIALVRRQPLWPGLRLFWHSVACGLLFGIEFIFFYKGAPYTTGGHISIFINTAPFFVAVGAHYFLEGDRMNPRRWGGLMLAFSGVVVIFWDDLFVQKTGLWRGDVMVLIASMLWGATTLYIKRYMAQGMDGFQLLFWQLLISTPLLLVSSWLTEAPGTADFNWSATGNLFFQGVVIVGFSYMAWMTLLRRYPASAMQSFTFLTPVWGVVLGAVLLGETVTLATVGGMALVGGGLVLVNRG